MSKAKAYQGANGWYVAWERNDGFHHQCEGSMTEQQARKKAKQMNDDPYDDDDDYSSYNDCPMS